MSTAGDNLVLAAAALVLLASFTVYDILKLGAR